VNKPTEADMIRMQWSHEDAWHEGNRAGLAHGKAEAWRDTIEALRSADGRADDEPSAGCAECCADYLERLGKELGYVA
jgi:hypothetical protein